MAVALTTYEVMDQRAAMLGVLSEVLAEVGSEHALIGGIAVGYHSRVRATVDVDLLVPKRKMKKIVDGLEARGFVVTRHHGMVRVYPAGADPTRDEAVADLVEREANPVLLAAAKLTEPATVLGHAVHIVPRGALVALKFQAAVSPTRAVLDRQQDIVDMGRIIATRFEAEDEAAALQIAELIYPGARDELARVIDDHRHGRPVRI